MFQSTIAVFKEIVVNHETMFQWFRVANEDEDGHIVVECILSEEELFERLAFD